MSRTHTVLRAVGSLWFAGVLLALLLVAMACATVFESLKGTEPALGEFYHSWWFRLLLVGIGINVLAAVLVRLPLTARQAGFFITHLSILVTLGGALVTEYLGSRGQVGLIEGQTASQFSLAGHETLLIDDGKKQDPYAIDLGEFLPTRLKQAEIRWAGRQLSGSTRVEVLRYVPDSTWEPKTTNDSPVVQRALEIAFGPAGQREPHWVFAGQSVSMGGVEVAFRRVEDRAELHRLVNPASAPSSQLSSKGFITVEYQGQTFGFPLEQGLGKPVPLGETGFTARVLRYLPHATVGTDNQVVNASDRPVNPYVEVEFAGPESKETQRAFARFPEFSTMHGSAKAQSFKLTFKSSAEETPSTPVEVLEGTDGEMYVRFSPRGAEHSAQPLEVGEPVGSPWPGRQLTVIRRYDHARVDWTLLPVEPVRESRTPAVLVRLSAAGSTNEAWVQKYQRRPLMVGSNRYEVSYVDASRPLGFELTLDRFRIGYYPGGMRPRSFESHVTVVHPATGRTESRVISMNHPAKFGRYTLYQSSYRQEKAKTVSFLSVSSDPGQPIVFVGYIAMIVGMLVVLGTRVATGRRRAAWVAGSGAGNRKAEK
ncbi:MAG: cytochrome c biogenesis protein ResB [Phycisphaerales bacterium]|nr:MAG: cytochrome c biogenesis protein ResB [Phycisphaerales bacterium]